MPPPEPGRRPARVAIVLALADKIQAVIDCGVVRDRAEVATRRADSLATHHRSGLASASLSCVVLVLACCSVPSSSPC
jgi:hypothetical protein